MAAQDSGAFETATSAAEGEFDRVVVLFQESSDPWLFLFLPQIMFYGYPVERLCTYQYSLVSLIPGLLLALQDSGDPSMDKQSSVRSKAESLKTSDRKSLIRFMGLPLHLFGQVNACLL